MSQAAKSDSEEGLGNVLACTQCNERVRPEASRDARHGLPCGHIVCGPCTAKIGVEQKESPTEAVCRSAGCGRTFEHASEFFTAWCVQREARLAGALTDLLKDQGDRGCEGKALTEAVFDVAASARKDDAGSWGLCTKHSKEISALHAVTLHALCGDCPERDEDGVSEVSAAVAGLAKTEGTLEQFAGQIDSCDLAPQDLRAGVDKWASDEAKRIKAWEEREVKAVHAVAAEALALVEETRARRLEVGASVLRQLLGLRTTISELVYELAHPPAGKAASLQHALALATEQRRLAALLSEGRLALPAPATVEAWAEPPTLASCFDISPANGAPLSTATGAAATLSLRLLRDLGPGAVAGRLVPVMPKLVSSICAPSIRCFTRSWHCVHSFALSLFFHSPSLFALLTPHTPPLPQNPGHRVQHFPILHTWPSVITAVDDQFAVVGFYSSTPLQLWDLKNLRKVRDFDGDNKYCSQIINLPAATIAAVGSRGSDGYVAIYNILSGKRLHELTGHTPIVATAYSGGHLFTLGHSDKQLRVWRQTSSGNVSSCARHVILPCDAHSLIRFSRMNT